MSKRQHNRKSGHQAEDHRIRLVDDLNAFDEFKEKILPALRRDLLKGMPSEKLREKYSAYITAGMITTALIDEDPGKRLAAGKDLIDRVEGKAKERKEIEHRLTRLSEDELNAVIASEIQDLDELEKQKH